MENQPRPLGTGSRELEWGVEKVCARPFWAGLGSGAGPPAANQGRASLGKGAGRCWAWSRYVPGTYPAKPTPISQVASAEDPTVLVATTAEARSWTWPSSCLGSCACGPAEMQPDTLSQAVTFPYRGWSSHGIYRWLLTLVSCIPKIHPTIERFCTCSCTGAAGNRPPACQSHTHQSSCCSCWASQGPSTLDTHIH